MGGFEFDIDLLISVLEGRPVLWDRTGGICKDRNETEKTWREVCIVFKKTSKLQEMLSSAIIY